MFESDTPFNRDLYSRLVEAVPDAIVVAGKNGEILLVNAQTERLFDYDRRELLGQSVEILVPARLRRGHSDQYGLRKDGSKFPVEISLTPLRSDQGEFLTIAAIRDVSERIAAEANFRSLLDREKTTRKQLEVANRMKDEFLVTLSHELRTPLSAILGWAHVLGRGNLPAAQVDKAIETIERNARSQLQLIEDLLDVSRIISGKIRVESRPVDLRDVTESAIEVIRPTADTKRITLMKDIPDRVKLVAGDPDRLQQVIWNLLSNAVKFTPKHGWVKVALDETDDYVRLMVEDSGEGIAPEFLPHIFDRFSQADRSTTRQHGGLGLGLAIVRQLVEAQGGAVQAWSAGKGKGAEFTVLLPALDGQPSVTGSRASLSAQDSLRGRRLLVVDDRLDELSLFRTILEAQGADVQTAGSVREALALLEEHGPPDVLVSDIAMPEQDGYELLRIVRALPPELGGQVPAIAITAHARREDRDRVLAAGFTEYIAKPVDPATLVETVASVAES